MECPRCGSAIERPSLGAGASSTSCNHCGWGKNRTAPVKPGPTFGDVPPVRGLKLSMLILVSAALLVGPYWALERYLGATLPPDWRLYYLGIVPVYLFLSWAITPNPDMDDLGWFGGLMDNPFSFSDGYNRFLLFLGLLLLPGKLILYTAFSFIMLWRS